MGAHARRVDGRGEGHVRLRRQGGRAPVRAGEARLRGRGARRLLGAGRGASRGRDGGVRRRGGRRLPAAARCRDRGRPVDGHHGGRAAADVQGAHGLVPVRVVARRADAMARLRSWLGSGFALPPRTRESERSPRRRKRRERKLAKHLVRQAGGRVKSEGKGWEYPLTASLGASGPTSATRWPAPRWGGDQHLLYADKWRGN